MHESRHHPTRRGSRRALPAALLACALSSTALAAEPSDDEPVNFQAWLGVLELDDQSGKWEEISDGAVDVDFSNLPGGGVEGEYLFYQGWVHAGLNPGGSITWKNDDTRFSGGFTGDTGAVLRADIDNSLLLLELHLGAFVRGRLHERVTTYGAAGPMLMYGYHEVEDESVTGPVAAELDLQETDSSDVNLGFYARAGIDFEYAEHRHLGVGLRYLYTELDFDKTVGELDIEGVQYLLTYTQRM